MAKNEQSREANQPIWFDGKSINEALFVMISSADTKSSTQTGLFSRLMAA